MDLLAIGNHLLNFLAPVCAVGWLLALAGMLFPGTAEADTTRAGRLRRAWRSGWINTLVAGVASTASLVMFGRDGEMAGYAMLVLAAASSQWLLMQGWRR